MKVKILIGSPVHEHKKYCIEDFVEHALSLDGDFDLVLVDNTRESGFRDWLKERFPKVRVESVPWCSDAYSRMVLSYNRIREIVINEDYDYLLTLECDVFPPKNVIPRFLGHNVDVVAGIYPIRAPVRSVVDRNHKYYCVWKPKEHGIIPIWLTDREINQGLLKWNSGFSYGCCLISRRVFNDFVFREAKDRWACPDAAGHEDFRLAGFDTYVDTDVVCEHRYGNWEKVRESDHREREQVRRKVV